MVAGSTPEEEVQTILRKKREMVEKVVRNFLREGWWKMVFMTPKG